MTGQAAVDAHRTDGIIQALAGSAARIGDVVGLITSIADQTDFQAFNAVYRSYFEEGRFPVRSLVQAQLAFGVAVEIEVQAVDSASAR